MSRKLGLMSKGYGVNSNEDKKREVYSVEFLKYGIAPCFFDWRSVSGGEVIFENADASITKKDSLNSLDYIAISSLGELGKSEKKFLDYLDMLKGVSPYVVNDPDIMERNLDKSYLLDLINIGVSVVPTQDAKGISYSDLDSSSVLKPRRFGEKGYGVRLSGSFDSEKEFNDYKNEHNGNILIQPFLKGIVENGERSFVYVGKELSHGIYRPREDWKASFGVSATEIISPSNKELDVINDIFDGYSADFRVTRFDFITDGDVPMISELEMVNPNVWVGRGIKEVDERFPFMLAEYLKASQ